MDWSRCQHGLIHRSTPVRIRPPQLTKNVSKGQRALQTKIPMTRRSAPCVVGVREQLANRGFALVDTPSFVDDGRLLRLKAARMVLPFYAKGWRQFPQLARYAYWLERLLGEALPEEAVSLTSLEFRHEPAGSEDEEVDRLHADGSYIRSVLTLYGPATIYREKGVERPVPDGQTLLLTAMERARAFRVPCTLHRRPGPGPERAVIVCSFEPHSQQPLLERVHQKVVQTHRPCANKRFSTNTGRTRAASSCRPAGLDGREGNW